MPYCFSGRLNAFFISGSDSHRPENKRSVQNFSIGKLIFRLRKRIRVVPCRHASF
ncbi:hypothetical protein KC19_VG236400 [Ceratodon purpureus]|uniref:Uncharacterized protein n=1 Tax=Ceratodon purpureus TaxID=3225 RepID=A0A8T0HTR3_CERPU|nr:hypothetical protein KC19_VG236400 [Ceratodon purpureus]